MVVLEPPVVEQELGFVETVEGFHVEELAAEVAVEGFDVGILPGCSRLDVAGRDAGEAAPVAECVGDELRAVVAADQLGCLAAPIDDPLENADKCRRRPSGGLLAWRGLRGCTRR